MVRSYIAAYGQLYLVTAWEFSKPHTLFRNEGLLSIRHTSRK
jgi:hypothetical protein